MLWADSKEAWVLILGFCHYPCLVVIPRFYFSVFNHLVPIPNKPYMLFLRSYLFVFFFFCFPKTILPVWFYCPASDYLPRFVHQRQGKWLIIVASVHPMFISSLFSFPYENHSHGYCCFCGLWFYLPKNRKGDLSWNLVIEWCSSFICAKEYHGKVFWVNFL